MAATAGTISAAMQQIDPKKEKLKKAFDELQSHSDVLSLFSLTWSDIDSHFTSLHNSLTQKLQLLQTLESQSTKPSSSTPISQTHIPQHPSDPSSSSNAQTQIEKDSSLEPKSPTQIAKDSNASITPTQKSKEPDSDEVPPRPELVAFCERMDAMGLMSYLSDPKLNRNKLWSELPGALRCAPDPATMVMNAMEGFYSGVEEQELNSVRRNCVFILEVLMEIEANVGVEVKERARKLALEWKGKASMDGESPFEVLGLLHLVAGYGVESVFTMDELVDYLVFIARYRQATELCRRFGLGDKFEDLIQKLVSDGKHLLAVKFISEFDMKDKFPIVDLLKAYVKESKRLAKKVSEEGNNSKKAANEAIAKETGALKSVIKFIEELKLESEYPPSPLENRIEQLEKERANRKRQAAFPARKPLHLQQQTKQKIAKRQQQPKQQIAKQQQYGNKRPRMTAPVGSSAVSNRAAGLFVKCPAPYVSSPGAPYGMSATAPPVAPYAGSSAGPYGFAGGRMGFPGKPSPSSTYLYTSEQHMPSGYYNRPTAYGGYGAPPKYHTSHYPQ